MTSLTNLSRRGFLKTSAVASGALLLGFRMGDAVAEENADGVFNPSAWLEITPDDQVIIHVPWTELGQGALTAMPLLLADELEIDWERVEIRRAWNDPRFGRMGTGGSRTVRTSWDPVRQAGAAARTMLIAAAAERWGVDPKMCRARLGRIERTDGGASLAYGDLVADAAKQDIPGNLTLKPRSERQLIGKSVPRVDIPDKVSGKTRFGLDQRLPGMKYAAIARPPVYGATVESFDDTAARKLSGVRDVFAIDAGVAVLADDTWTVLRARDALQVEWSDSEHANLDTAAIEQRLRDAKIEQGEKMRDDGDFDAADAAAATTVAAVYEIPYISHSPMEPMNCTVKLTGDRCEVWAPIQSVTWGQQVAAQAAGVPPENVRIQPTFCGGGFGRRLMVEYVGQTVQIARHAGVPVQLVYSREENTKHGFYRPISRHAMRAALDADGHPTGWRHHLAAPSISGQLNPRNANPRDEGAVDGAVTFPYTCDNVRVVYSMVNTPVPVGWLRSVYNTQNALAAEAFLDEVITAAGADPVQWRLDHLPADSRLRGTLQRAAKAWGWPRKLAKGHGQGIACHSCFGSHVTTIAEVSREGSGVRVHRVLSVVDCGPVVHPDGLISQMEGVVGFALSALLHEGVEISGGRVAQGNFDDYPILTLAEMPEVEVIAVDSEDPIGGIGEPGYPPLGPAVLNALYAATGERVRKLPLLRNLKG